MSVHPLQSLLSGPLGQRQEVHQPPDAGLSIESLLLPERDDRLIRSEREITLRQDLFWSSYNFEYLRRKLSASSDEIRNAVEMNVRIVHGNPVFCGTRVPIYQIVEELADGTTLAEIVEGYPSLTVETVQHGLDFAASLLRIYDEQIPD